MSSTGVDWKARWGAGSSCAPALRCDVELVGVVAWLFTQSPKSLSAAASVGFSLVPRAGVPVRERARRVDLPNEPVSATARRDLVLPPSFLHPRVSMTSLCISWHSPDGLLVVLVKNHGIGSLDAVVANVTFVIGDVVKN